MASQFPSLEIDTLLVIVVPIYAMIGLQLYFLYLLFKRKIRIAGPRTQKPVDTEDIRMRLGGYPVSEAPHTSSQPSYASAPTRSSDMYLQEIKEGKIDLKKRFS